MPRPFKRRRVCCNPDVNYFKPRGIPVAELEEINLTMDELEAIRLADLESLSHEESAAKMNVSRATFGRIVSQGRKKIASALVHGKAIRVQGGEVELRPPGPPFGRGRGRHRGGRGDWS